MYFKRERSTATVIVLQIVQVILYFIAFALVLVAAGLFSRALTHINTNIIDLEKDVCILFITDSTSNPSPSICHGAIAIEALTAVGLMVLVIVSFLKIALEMIKNNIFLIFEIISLTVTATLAVLGAFLLCAGWGFTCDTFNDYLKEQGIDADCNIDFLQNVTGAAACSGTACIFFTVGVFIFIINSVLSRQSAEAIVTN